MTNSVNKTKVVKKYFRDIKINIGLMSTIYNSLKSNKRNSIANTKTRGEVSGGGRKPWRQKGTGRARQGSTRSPQWIGGGITFGPRSIKNYQKNINKKIKKFALIHVLANFEKNKKLIIVAEIPKLLKTKEAVIWIAKQPVEEGKITLLTDTIADDLKAYNNIDYLDIQNINGLHMDIIMESDYIITTEKIVNSLQKSIISPIATTN